MDMLAALCLLTSLAGFVGGTAIAFHLGHHVGLIFPSADHWDWQALVLAFGSGLGALEIAVRAFTSSAEDE